MSFGAVKIWRDIIQEERAALYATPERVAEIERRQPEALERGRALFYRPGTVTGTVAQRSKSHPVVEEVEPEPIPTWRKTFEFTGEEAALADGEEVLELEEVFIEVAA